MLALYIGLVTHPDRPHALVARERRVATLGQGRFEADAVYRLDMAVVSPVYEVAQEREVALQDVQGAEAGEGLSHVVGVTQPAVAVVRVASAAGRLGNGRGQGGDDGAGVLVLAQLQRDGRAVHRRVVVERERQGSHPGL